MRGTLYALGKKVINVLFSLFSLMWAIVSAYGVYFNLSGVWSDGYIGMTAVDILAFWLLTIGMIVLCVSLVVCAIRSCWYRSGQNNKKRLTIMLLWLILNAVGICLRTDVYAGALLMALFGDVVYQSSIMYYIYHIDQFLTSEFFCIITMLQLMTICVFDEANGSVSSKICEHKTQEEGSFVLD